MTLAVTELRAETVEWDAFVRASADGSPFHLTAWKRVVEEIFDHRPHYLMARHGDTIEGVLPLFEVGGLLTGRALVSVPYGVYGGICARSDAARRALLDAATALGRGRRAAYVELRHRRHQGLDLATKALYVTFARSISSDIEANARAIPGKQRRMTRQGAKHGLRAEIGRNHLEGFYEIYARSVHALGSPVFPRQLFRALLDTFDKECQILTVWRGQAMVAGVLTLFYEDQVLPYYGGALPEALPDAVNDFMYWQLMCHAGRAGYRIFDFGRSRQRTGSYNFKRHWGFEPTPLPYQYVLLRRREVPNASPGNPRFKLAVETWKRLPFAVTKVLGPLLTRYLP
ncbi:MAG: FemAB family PEP-CTERM system-associated protein [Candidatus Rokubacteria bacterium]|nr:FemAB family PEP-CTERM system-associated protein [Candidatus Rokubacteria bacterium]